MTSLRLSDSTGTNFREYAWIVTKFTYAIKDITVLYNCSSLQFYI